MYDSPYSNDFFITFGLCGAYAVEVQVYAEMKVNVKDAVIALVSTVVIQNAVILESVPPISIKPVNKLS